MASIAATGFGLTALCIGQQRGYVSFADARERVAPDAALALEKMPHHRGFFYHWANIKTGERIWDSEVSSIDTALLLCGVLTCRRHFRSSEITRLANEIFNRVEWTWLSEDTNLLPHGWSPEGGFLPYRWDYYSELMMMYLLGLGSASHPLPAGVWNAWKRITFEYDGMRYIGSYAPLFVHQYSAGLVRFPRQARPLCGLFQEFHHRHGSASALLPGIAQAVSRLQRRSVGHYRFRFRERLRGVGRAAAYRADRRDGGAERAGGSLPFLPQATLRVLKHMKERYGAHAWSRYGFVNAFNPLTNWFDTDVIAIDTGITMLMAENLRTGFVWNTFMRNPEAQRGLRARRFL